MPWSPDGSDAPVLERLGWTVDGPDVAAPEPVLGWWSIPQRTLTDSAGIDDLATIGHIAIVGKDGAGLDDSLYMGPDPTQDFEVRIPVRDSTGVDDYAQIAHLTTQARDDVLADDYATLGLRGTDNAGVDDYALAKPTTPARDNTGVDDLATARPKLTGRDATGMDGAAVAGFSAVAGATTTYNTVGTFTFTIPVWCRYIDLIGLGGGAGGTGGGTFTGNGGGSSSWATRTLERGVDIPWSATALSVVVGDGGSAGGAFGGTGGGGNPTYIQYSSTDLIRSNGGSANSGTGGTRTGRAVDPNTTTVGDGQTYTGGSASTSSTAQVPGSGGYGGSNFAAGNKGGRGQAWIRARQ